MLLRKIRESTSTKANRIVLDFFDSLKSKPSTFSLAERTSAWRIQYAGKPMLMMELPALPDLNSLTSFGVITSSATRFSPCNLHSANRRSRNCNAKSIFYSNEGHEDESRERERRSMFHLQWLHFSHCILEWCSSWRVLGILSFLSERGRPWQCAISWWLLVSAILIPNKTITQLVKIADNAIKLRLKKAAWTWESKILQASRWHHYSIHQTLTRKRLYMPHPSWSMIPEILIKITEFHDAICLYD